MRLRLALVTLAWAAGLAAQEPNAEARLGVGTDTPTPWIVPGASLHRELELLVDCGIPAAEVRRMATGGDARALQLEKEVGGVREGLKADLVVLQADPTADIHNSRTIESVLHDGVARRPAEILAEN